MGHRLVEAATDTCASPPVYVSDEWFSYDARGQATDYYQSSTNSGGWYHVQQSYWPNGLVNTLQAFSGTGTSTPITRLFTNAPDGEGRRYTVKDGTSSSFILASTGYNTASQPTQANLTGSAEAFQYDASSGRMTQWNSTSGGQYQTGNLTWNSNGTLRQLQIADNFNAANAQTCLYGYDDLARLLSANCSPLWSQTFSYDVFGNIKKSGNVSYNPVYNANNRASTSTYDAAGNTLNDGSTSYTYDSEGRPQTVGSNSIVYDAFNRMVEFNNGSTHTQMLFDPQGTLLGQMRGQSLSWYLVPLAGGLQALYGPGGLDHYRHVDWLGSSRLQLTINGGLYSSRAFAPFGETYAEVGVPDRSFTGQIQDFVQGQTGVYDFLLRQHAGRKDAGWCPILPEWPLSIQPTPRPGTDMRMWPTIR